MNIDQSGNRAESRVVKPTTRYERPAVRMVSWSLLAGMWFTTARADSFAAVNFDAAHDELVLTMAYRGTNPDHGFSIQWGTCQTSAGGSEQELAADVLDSQSQDPARQPYTKIVRLSLADIPCRPVKLTLRTAPRFLYTLRIPAARR